MSYRGSASSTNWGTTAGSGPGSRFGSTMSSTNWGTNQAYGYGVGGSNSNPHYYGTPSPGSVAGAATAGTGVKNNGGTATTSPGGSSGGAASADHRSKFARILGRDPTTGRLLYDRVGPAALDWDRNREDRWRPYLATQEGYQYGPAPATDATRVYNHHRARDGDKMDYGDLSDIFVVPTDAQAHYSGDDVDGNRRRRLCIDIDFAEFWMFGDIHGALAHIGPAKRPVPYGIKRHVEMYYHPPEHRWRWFALVPVPRPTPTTTPTPGSPPPPPPPPGPTTTPNPYPTGGTPSTPTGGTPSSPTSPTGGGTTPSGGSSGSGSYYENYARWVNGGGVGTPPTYTGPATTGAAGTSTNPAGPRDPKDDPPYQEMQAAEWSNYSATRADGGDPNGLKPPLQTSSADTPNQWSGIYTNRSVGAARGWYGTPLWASGVGYLTNRPARGWRGSPAPTDPGILPAAITSPTWTAATADTLTKVTQSDYDGGIRDDMTWHGTASRLNATSDYLQNLNAIVRSERTERFTATVLAGAATVVVTTDYAWVGASVPELVVNAVGAYGVSIDSYSGAAGSVRSATLRISDLAPVGGIELSGHWTYAISRTVTITADTAV